MNVLSVCAGYGGLDLGLRIAAPAARTVCWVEREAAACQVLVSRMSEGWLDQAPIWTDATTFDGKPWRGVVDCIAAGIPCQPWSLAGKREGFNDDRHLGEHLVRTVGEVGPRLVFVENVAGFVRLGLPDLLGRLADIGYDAQWGMFSAAGVGAPHRRQRVFLLAYRDGGRLESDWLGSLLDGERAALGHDADGRDEGVGDPPGSGLQGTGRAEQWQLQAQEGCRLGDRPKQPGGCLGHTYSERLERRSLPGRSGSDQRAPWPPGPEGDWARVPARLHPATEPSVRGVADGSPGRVDRLRMLGNGVVPLAAAHAFRTLLKRAVRAGGGS